MLRGLYILDSSALLMVYGPSQRQAIERRVSMVAPPQTRQSIQLHPDLLSKVDVIFSGWGSPRVDRAFLDAAPNLKVIFYAGGAIGSWVTDAVWDRKVLVTSASLANAIPVAEYTLACILFSLKHGWKLARQTREERWFPPRDAAPGNYKSTVGLASLGIIGRTLLKLLAPFDLKVLVYDPFVSHAEAAELGVEKVTLEELFHRGDVVSIHTPSLPETEGMVTGMHLASMKHGATFINTSRGELVRENEMIQVLMRRPDLQAVLDVTEPEPPTPDSPFYTLKNVMLTPHIAGSAGKECQRMAQYMVDELERYIAGETLKYVVTPQAAAHSSHRPTISVKIPNKLAANQGLVSQSTANQGLAVEGGVHA